MSKDAYRRTRGVGVRGKEPGLSAETSIEASPGPSGSASQAARFITGVTWHDLPPEVVRKAKLCLADTLAAMVAGRPAGSTKIAAELAMDWWPATDARLIFNGEFASAAGAAFANGVAANAIDIDDCGRYTWGHPGAVVIPAALALAEQGHLSGPELITAIVVGYEIAFRAGRCLNEEPSKNLSPDRDYRACGSWGSLASAAIACHVLDLDEATTKHALGIAEYHSPDLPMMRDIDTPGMVKHGIGVGAHTGIFSAELARRGFTGIVSSLDLPNFRPFVEDIGRDYILPNGITWKRFASCSWTHAPLLAIESLQARTKIAPETVSRIVVETHPDAARLGTRLPTTTEEAQFNLAWPIAAFLLDGEVGPEQVLGDRLSSPECLALCERVEVRVSEELTRLYYLTEVDDPDGKEAAIVTITLTDGTVLSSGPVENVLYPEPGWGVDEIEAKFRRFVRGQLDPAAVTDILARIWNIDAIEDVSEFMDHLTASLTFER